LTERGAQDQRARAVAVVPAPSPSWYLSGVELWQLLAHGLMGPRAKLRGTSAPHLCTGRPTPRGQELRLCNFAPDTVRFEILVHLLTSQNHQSEPESGAVGSHLQGGGSAHHCSEMVYLWYKQGILCTGECGALAALVSRREGVPAGGAEGAGQNTSPRTCQAR
jgi:hypothetical protein